MFCLVDEKGMKALKLVTYVILALVVLLLVAEGVTGVISTNVEGVLSFLDALTPF